MLLGEWALLPRRGLHQKVLAVHMLREGCNMARTVKSYLLQDNLSQQYHIENSEGHCWGETMQIRRVCTDVPFLPSPSIIMILPSSKAFPSPSRLKLLVDHSTSSGICSIPITFPSDVPESDTRWCKTAQRYPEPEPTSSTRAPGWRKGRRFSTACACWR